MQLPTERGPLSALVAERLRSATVFDADDTASVRRLAGRVADPLGDPDLHLALATCYELHYAGFDEVDDRWEWEPSLLAVRAALEAPFEGAVRRLAVRSDDGAPVDLALRALVDADESPSVSAYLLKRGTEEQLRDFVRERSVYHLREADAHTWVVPRVRGRAKAALVEIQADEYGGGRPGRMHAELFARTMRALGLDDTYGAHWNTASGETFASINLMSLLGLHRRWRGAALGHLAVLEMTSTTPHRRYGNALRRLGHGPDATWFYDEHVEADAVHEQLAAVDMCGGLVAAEPGLRADVLLGAAACLDLEGRAAGALLRRWGADTSAQPPQAVGA